VKLCWSRRAQQQFHETIVYLEDQRPGTGLSLHAAVGEVAELVQRHPQGFPRVPGVAGGEVRRALISRYKHWLIYEIVEDGAKAIVLAIWSNRRRPFGWRQNR
jgi:plasmid stabilization system protein ParE